jgi:hypothetical protein
MEQGKRLLFTGISGVDVAGSLGKFIAYSKTKGFDFEKPYCLNDYMHDIEKKKNPNIIWLDILTYPYQLLTNLWNEALNEFYKEIEKSPEKNYILVIHSCFYHQFTQEFISFVNLELLKTFSAEKVITFIDDIDDIHLRLKENRRIFSQELGGACEKDVENIFELKKILDWRANETLLSRFYASQLRINHFIFAVKHPCDTLFKLVYEDKNYLKIYLSHPITKIRDLLFAKDFSEAENQVKPISHITNYLSERSICFFPTSIDELRLDADTPDTRYSQRWEEKKYLKEEIKVLYASTKQKTYLPYSEEQISKILDTDVYSEGKSEKEINIETEEKKRKKLQFHHLLNHFLKEVNKQVGIRDKMLVEQSDAIFVTRPYLNGKISHGVQTEIDYIKKLHPNHNEKLGIIFFPEEDHKDTKVYQVKEGFPAFIYSSQVFILDTTKEDECKKLIVEKFKDRIVQDFQNETILVVILQDIIAELLKANLISKNQEYSEKALDSQTSYKMTTHYTDFSKKLISAYYSLTEQLNDYFVVYKDEYQTESIINEFLKTKK